MVEYRAYATRRRTFPARELRSDIRARAACATCRSAWLQWSTANVAADVKEPQYRIVDDSVRLTGPLFGAATNVPSRYRSSHGPTSFHPKRKSFPGLASPRRRATSSFPSVPPRCSTSMARLRRSKLMNIGFPFSVAGGGSTSIASRLESTAWQPGSSADDTDFVVAFNEDIKQPREIELWLPAKDVPLSEAAILHRDGSNFELLPIESGPEGHKAHDRLGYYGVYQFAFSPVRIETPELVLQPARGKSFSCEITNLTDSPVRGHVQAKSVIPTISGDQVEIELNARETKNVFLTIDAAPTVDWGKKTIDVELTFTNRRAVVLRELIIQKPTDVELASVIVDPDNPQLELRVPENPFGETAPLTGPPHIRSSNGRFARDPRRR